MKFLIYKFRFDITEEFESENWDKLILKTLFAVSGHRTIQFLMQILE